MYKKLKVFFISELLVIYIIIFGEKDMIILVHENHDKWPNVTAVRHLFSGFDHANLVCSFHGS